MDSSGSLLYPLLEFKALLIKEVYAGLYNMCVIEDTLFLCYLIQCFVYTEGRSVGTMGGNSFNNVGYGQDSCFKDDLRT